jgi:hypothetical protein
MDGATTRPTSPTEGLLRQRRGQAASALPVSAGGSAPVAAAIVLTRAYHRELQLALPILQCVRSALATRGFNLTECRLLDIYLWAYSNTYEPLWKHRQTMAPQMAPGEPSQGLGPALAAVQEHSRAARSLGPDEFWDHDASYLEWLDRLAPLGVPDQLRAPAPEQLPQKLHRTSLQAPPSPWSQAWTNPYVKVCAPTIEVLDNWAMAVAGTRPDRCPVCRP